MLVTVCSFQNHMWWLCYTHEGIRREQISLTYGTSTLMDLLGIEKDFNLGYVENYRLSCFLRQQLENMGVFGKWVNIRYHTQGYCVVGFFKHICVDKTNLGGSWSYQPQRKTNYKISGILIRIWKIDFLQEGVNPVAVSSLRRINTSLQI